MKTGLRATILVFVLGIVLMIGSFLYFRYVVPYHVCFKEQIQLFVYNSSYLLSYFSKPAVLVCLAGDFLTQFFYFKTAGAVVITLLLVVEWGLIFLTLKQFSVKRYVALLWSLLPVIIECFFFPYISFSVALSVSFILVLLVFILYTKISGKISAAVGVILIPVLYMIAGASVFLFLTLAILYDIHCRRRRFVYWVTILGLSLVLPFLLRHCYLLTLKQAYFYPYSDIKQGLSLTALAFVVLFFVCFKNLRGENSGIIYFVIMLIVLVSILVIGLVKTTDRKQENQLGIMIEAYHNNWDKVLEIAERAELESPVATCYTNIALSKKSLLGERLMDFYQPFTVGLLLPIVPNTGWIPIFSGSDSYYHIGDMEMAQHAAMLGMIFSPRQRSARMAERLVEINQIKGDMSAAIKYKRLLESTLFHKIKPDRLKDLPQQGIFNKDIIRNSNDVKTSLELLTESNPDNLPALNYLLSYYLLNKEIPAFFNAYTAYCKGKYAPIPKIYAEALLIYFAATESSMAEVTSYGIHPEIITSFREYTQLYEKSKGNLAPMQKRFPNTYWLFYHFAIPQK